jgi:UDP-glucose 4-epimerase
MKIDYHSCYKNQVILITGGAGAIGRNLTEKIAALDAKKVIILDNMSSSYEWNIPNKKNILFIKGDICNDDDLKRVYQEKPAYVFHLAAFFANQRSVEYPVQCDFVNAIGTIKLLEYANISSCVKRFVYTNSEGGAYGSDLTLPYSENKISVKLGSPYYISKKSGEMYCKYYFEYHGLPVVTVRLFNSFGPGEVPGQYRNVIPNFIFWALNNQPLPLTGTGKMIRDFVYVDDTVDGIIRAGFFEEAVGESINIATGIGIDITSMANVINEITNNSAGVLQFEKRKWDTRTEIIGDGTLAKKLLDFEPKSDIKEGIGKTVKWFKDNWENICSSSDFKPGMSTAVQGYVPKNKY